MGFDGTGEGQARAGGADDLLILLEVVADSQESQARYGGRGNEQKTHHEQKSAGEGHAQEENGLVADEFH